MFNQQFGWAQRGGKKSFFTALSNQNYDEAAKYATPESKAALNMIKSLIEIGKKASESIKIEASEDANAEINTKLSKVEYGEPVIEGDKATLPITINNETNNIYLKNIDGEWKVAFDKNSMKQIMNENSAQSGGDINTELENAAQKLQNLNLDTLKHAMDKANNLLKSDTLKKST